MQPHGLSTLQKALYVSVRYCGTVGAPQATRAQGSGTATMHRSRDKAIFQRVKASGRPTWSLGLSTVKGQSIDVHLKVSRSGGMHTQLPKRLLVNL